MRAATKCDLFSLSADDYATVADVYPDMKEMMKKLAEVRLHCVGLADSVGNIDEKFW